MRFIVLTGLSGAGKTHALHALEDIGYYCVDNLPPMLLPSMAELCSKAEKTIDRVAVVVDVRGGVFFQGIEQALQDMGALGVDFEILFLDATDEELLRRYSETRRAHPLGNTELMIRSIQREREVLDPLRKNAHRVIDTTRMLTRELRETVVRLYAETQQGALKVNVLSFGFKRGMPQEADLVLDVRFLPNPYYIPEMRAMTGLDAPVIDYIHSFPETGDFLKKTLDLLGFLLPLYEREGKARLVIAVGCTGGQHRSVLLAQEIAMGIDELGFAATITHRDKP